MKDLNIKIYADGADLGTMLADYKEGIVSGFTTNPSLMKVAGVKDYLAFAKKVLRNIPDMPISFEVFADELTLMAAEGHKLASLGENVYVKIPIVTTTGESTLPLIQELSQAGLKLNITALMTTAQVKEAVDVLAVGTENIISVFAGRVADTGRDPLPLMQEAKKICQTKAGTELLWASTREVLNIFQAESIGADIITVPPGIIAKTKMVGMDLNLLSIETVKGFQKDISALGFSIL